MGGAAHGLGGLCSRSVLLGSARLRSAPLGSLSPPVRVCSAPLLERGRWRVQRTRSRFLLHLGQRSTLCFHFLLFRAVSGSLLSPLSKAIGLGLQILGLLLLLVQANKVFLSFFFFLTVLTGEIDSPGLPDWPRCLGQRAPPPGERSGKGRERLGPVLRRLRGGAGGREGPRGCTSRLPGPVGCISILNSIFPTCFRGLSP